MLMVLFCANAERNPPRVGNPLMFFCETLVQKCVTNWSRERNIDNAAHVHMADFRFTESEFPGCKAMRMNRDVRPPRNVLFQCIQWCVHWGDLPDSSFDARPRRLGICDTRCSIHAFTGLDHDRAAGYVQYNSSDPRCFVGSKEESSACHVFRCAKPLERMEFL